MKHLLLLVMLLPFLSTAQPGSRLKEANYAWKPVKFADNTAAFEKAFPTRKEKIGTKEYDIKGVYNEKEQLMTIQFTSVPVEKRDYTASVPFHLRDIYTVFSKKYGKPTDLAGQTFYYTEPPDMNLNSIMECYEWHSGTGTKVVMGVMCDKDGGYMAICEIKSEALNAAYDVYVSESKR